MHNLHLAYVLKQLRLDANYMSYSNDGTQDMNDVFAEIVKILGA